MIGVVSWFWVLNVCTEFLMAYLRLEACFGLDCLGMASVFGVLRLSVN